MTRLCSPDQLAAVCLGARRAGATSSTVILALVARIHERGRAPSGAMDPRDKPEDDSRGAWRRQCVRRESWTQRLFAVLLVAVALGAGPVQAQQQDQVARVKVIDGSAVVLRADERSALDVGAPIFVADVVETEAGSVGLTFTDGSRLSIGPNSRVQFTEFQFAPTEGRLAFIIDFFRGTLLYVSGVISKLAPDAVQVRTPVATVAVRGTRFLAEVEGD